MQLYAADAADDPDHTAPDLRPIPARTDPCAVAYDVHADALIVGDAYTGALVRIAGQRQRRIATLGSGPSMASVADRIGAIALTPYGTLFATWPGGVVRVEPDGQVEALDQLAAGVTRLGIAYDAREHALYATQFVPSRSGAQDGSVVAIDLVTGWPSTVIDGFAKPVGVAKLGSTLVIADARQRAVYRVDLVAGRAVRRLQLVGDIGRPDSLCVCGHDSVLVTSFDPDTGRGAVRKLWLDGRTHGIAAGPWEPRGVATDGERAFIALRRGGQVMVAPLRPSQR